MSDLININDVFPNKLCISLESRQDRRDATTAELGKYGIDFEFYDAKPPISDRVREIYNTRLLPGETGAFESHYDALNKAEMLEWESVLILEDDVELTPNFDVKFDEAIRKVPDNWDMIYFGGNHESEPQVLGNGLLKCTETYAIHMVAIRNTVYEMLKITCQMNQYAFPVDFLYATIHCHRNVYAFSPALAFQRIDYSDIQGEVVDYTILRKGHNAEK